MLDLAFLYKEGYEIDKEIMVDHAQALLNYTVGDGWYRDIPVRNLRCGWERRSCAWSFRRNNGTNPDSKGSIVICASMKSRKQYGSAEPYLLISQVITAELPEQAEEKENGECVFTEEELFPIREILYEDMPQTGAYGTTTICLKTDEVRKVNFEGTEAAF